MIDAGRLLVVMGLAVTGVGALLLVAGRWSWPGHLPGDLSIRGSNGSVYFPIATCLIVSLVLTIALNLVGRLLNR